MQESTTSDITQQRKQAFLDAQLSRKANQDRFKHRADPILQQNEYFVTKISYNKTYNKFFNILYSPITNTNTARKPKNTTPNTSPSRT